MNKHFLIIDGNSLAHVAQNTGRLSVGTMDVHAIYGFLRMLRSYCAKWSMATPVVLWDGISWRYSAFPDYKSNREKSDTKHDQIQVENKKSLQSQRPHIEKALSFLGVTQVRASNMEADDLAAIMSDLYADQGHHVILLSEDQDWLQLIRPNVIVDQIVSKRIVGLKNFEEITDCANPKGFVQKKALMGDRGDGINGIGGVGKKRAVEFVREFGSFQNFLNIMLLESPDKIKKLPKWQRDLIEDEGKAIAFSFNMSMVDLRSTERPNPVDMFVVKGEPSAGNFRRMCDLLLFQSITRNYEDWLSVFPISQQAISQPA